MDSAGVLIRNGDDDDAIVVSDVWLTYGRGQSACHALRGLNLTAPTGKIYGLLGPSGCGKTSLLSCIMGRAKISKGIISVFGQLPGYISSSTSQHKIGYMPQDVGLNDQLTVKETLQFFGMLGGMNQKEIDEKSEFLMKFLKITFSKKLICKLSGGQRRRTSFAVALLNQPDLLILDEPTVGVDPVLRLKIWDYLISLTKSAEKPTTIIITTHYVEEARLAHKIGFMLEGQLLIQSSPSQLIDEHKCEHLEQVFLKLCIENKIDSNSDTSIDPTEVNNKMSATCKQNDKVNYEAAHHSAFRHQRIKMPELYRIKALIWKNFHFLRRYIGYFVFEILLPPLTLVLFALTIGNPLYGIPVGIVNHDSHELGQSYLDCFRKDFISPVPYDTYDDAAKAAIQGAIMGMIYINPNFSETMTKRVLTGGLTDDVTIENSVINIAIDESSPLFSLYFHMENMNAFNVFTAKLLKSLDFNPEAGRSLLKFKTLADDNSSISFTQYIFPGILIMNSFFMAMALTAVLLIRDRKTGIYDRSLVIGAGAIDYILSHVFCQSVTLVLQLFLCIIIPFFIVGFTCQGSYVLVIALIFLQGLCGMCLGLGISSLLNDETCANVVSIGLWLVLLFCQGFLWPLEGMWTFFQSICMALPQTYAVMAIRSIINRGWGIEFPVVIYGFSVTLAWIIALLLLSWILSHRRL